ncbi:MAG TPA: hypothetical protein VFX57_04680 [Sulfuricurvum sp.]|nr:hypothetical protein [Sulfuricurvum sp.]
MKNLVIAALIAVGMNGSLEASDFDIGISGSERGIDGFSLSIGDYYHVPRNEILLIERSVPRDEMSVVYFLARESHRDARYISNLRLRGLSWWDISLRLGLNPHNLYVVDSRRYSGPPYGRAYGYHNEGRQHRLQDHEIVELVNVRFLSRYHGVSVDEVIDRRRSGERYMHINDAYRGQKFERKQNVKHQENRYREKEKGRYREKEHGNGRGRE